MTEPPPYAKMPSDAIRDDCFSLVLWKAQKWNVPPAYIVAHIRQVNAVAARREVMLTMLEWGLTRSQVALAFGRDLRRVRASVIGKPKRRRRIFHDYARFDLFGVPVVVARAKETRQPRERTRRRVEDGPELFRCV